MYFVLIVYEKIRYIEHQIYSVHIIRGHIRVETLECFIYKKGYGKNRKW